MAELKKVDPQLTSKHWSAEARKVQQNILELRQQIAGLEKLLYQVDGRFQQAKYAEDHK